MCLVFSDYLCQVPEDQSNKQVEAPPGETVAKIIVTYQPSCLQHYF